MCVCVCFCVYACVHACLHVCVCVCVFVCCSGVDKMLMPLLEYIFFFFFFLLKNLCLNRQINIFEVGKKPTLYQIMVANENYTLTFMISPLCTRSTSIIFSLRTDPSLSISTNTASEACRDISLASASDVFPCHI